ncbi:hypothetical protein D9M68_920070 [compost metagenome]
MLERLASGPKTPLATAAITATTQQASVKPEVIQPIFLIFDALNSRASISLMNIGADPELADSSNVS